MEIFCKYLSGLPCGLKIFQKKAMHMQCPVLRLTPEDGFVNGVSAGALTCSSGSSVPGKLSHDHPMGESAFCAL